MIFSPDGFAAIAALDLDPIKIKLMHEESGKGWTPEYASTIETEYRRFLYLVKKFPNVVVAPLPDTNLFWRYHILDTMKYQADCDKVFGYFLHYCPSGVADKEEEPFHGRGRPQLKALYEASFGEPYPRASQSEQVSRRAERVISLRETAYCYITDGGTNSARETAYCYITDGGTKSARETAYCYITDGGTKSARETAYCYITDGGTKSVRETAYCYITDGGTKSARETAYCYITDGGGTTAARDSLSCYAPDVRTRPSLARYSLLAN
jgi:hypothetical protein